MTGNRSGNASYDVRRCASCATCDDARRDLQCVVAEEVRKLAEKSRAAAGQISGLVGEIQSETDSVVVVVADGARRTEDGVTTVERTRVAFQAIGESIEDVTAR